MKRNISYMSHMDDCADENASIATLTFVCCKTHISSMMYVQDTPYLQITCVNNNVQG